MGLAASVLKNELQTFRFLSPEILFGDNASVYQKLKERRFKSDEEMNAVGIMIYELAVNAPPSSLKCAHLTKMLEDLTIKGTENTFRQVYGAFFFAFMIKLIQAHNDAELSKERINVVKAVAMYIGNLMIVDFLEPNLARIILQEARKRKNEKNSFFEDTIAKTVSTKIKNFEEFMMEGKVEELLTEGTVCVCNECSHLKFDKVSQQTEYFKMFMSGKIFDFNKKFQKMSTEKFQREISCLFKETCENGENLRVYRQIATDISQYNLEQLNATLSNEFMKYIKKFDHAFNPKCAAYEEKVINLGYLVNEFFHTGFIGDEIVEQFLDMIISSRVPPLIFTWNFVDCLIKYEGSKLHKYLEYLGKWRTYEAEHEYSYQAVQCYLKQSTHFNGNEMIQLPNIRCTAQPDLREYLFKRSSPDVNFQCDDRPSCHFAALRGLNILISHNNHKFFTQENLDICVELTKKMLKIPSTQKICKTFVLQMTTLSPYFENNMEPNEKIKNFSKLVAVCYRKDILIWYMANEWLNMLLKTEASRHKFNLKYIKIQVNFLADISKKLIRDNPNEWKRHYDWTAQFQIEDTAKLEALIARDVNSNNREFKGHKELMKIRLPNDIFSLKYPQLNKNRLLIEFQNGLVNHLGYYISLFTSNKSNPQHYQKAEKLIDLLEAFCIKSIATRVAVATALETISFMFVKNPPVIVKLMNYAIEKLLKYLDGPAPLPPKISALIQQSIENFNDILDTHESSQKHFPEAVEIVKILRKICPESTPMAKITQASKDLKSEIQKEQIPENFYSDFIIQYRTSDQNFGKLIKYIKDDEDEMDKLILNFWDILLKEQPQPSNVELCTAIAEPCANFLLKLGTFLAEQYTEFHANTDEVHNADENQRLGNIVIFMAEAYESNLIDDEVLMLWIQPNLIEKLPKDALSTVFRTFCSCKRLENSENIELKCLIKNIDDLYFKFAESRLNSIRSYGIEGK